MVAPVTCRSCLSDRITRQMCSKMSVSRFCVATTLMVHGSAGLTPQSVEKILESNLPTPALSLRSCLPICVSHSDATTKILSVLAFIRLEHARGANVPPECDTMITMVSVRSQTFSMVG